MIGSSLDPLSTTEQAPGNDTRQWVSYAIVDNSTEEIKNVEFTDMGPLVNVTLQPSGVPIRCRVGMDIGGKGEGEYCPFMDGDEVLVAIVEGDERAGGVIIKRMSNTIDTFPKAVGGQDIENNSVGFMRTRVPYVFEFAGGALFRSAGTGASIIIGPSGDITIQDGSSAFCRVGVDFIGMQTGDAKVSIQGGSLDNGVTTALAVDLTAGSAKATFSEEGFQFNSPKSIAMSASGFPANHHVATSEAMLNFFTQFLTYMVTTLTALPPPPLIPAALAAILNPVTVMPAVMGLAAVSPNIPAVTGLLQAAFAGKVPDPTGLIPGLGSSAVLVD